MGILCFFDGDFVFFCGKAMGILCFFRWGVKGIIKKILYKYNKSAYARARNAQARENHSFPQPKKERF